MKESPFIAVLKRELDRMVSRRIYFASCIVLPLFSIFFMATIFGNGQMENLPVGVVERGFPLWDGAKMRHYAS